MENQIYLDEASKESFFKRIFNRLTSGTSYWIRGGKIGLLILVSLSLICLISAPILIGFVGFNLLTEYVLNPISRDITGIDLSADIGGYFSFHVPNFFGWLYLTLISFLAGAFIGSIFDIIKRKKIIPSIFFIIFALVFGTYLYLAHFASYPLKCALLFDGPYYPVKSECLLESYSSSKNYDDPYITLLFSKYYTYKSEFNERNKNCLSEINIFHRKENSLNGIFAGKVFVCRDDTIHYTGFFLNNRQKPISFIGNKKIGNYSYTINQSDDKTRLIYVTKQNNISISIIFDKDYRQITPMENDLLYFESFISGLSLKNNFNVNQNQLSQEYFSNSNEDLNIDKNQTNQEVLLNSDKDNSINKDQTSQGNSSDKNYNDELISLKYSQELFEIIRDKQYDDKVWIGRYTIYSAINHPITSGNEVGIVIKKNSYPSDLNKLENEANKFKNSDGMITQVQRIKLGNYEYVKIIHKDSVEYQLPIGNIVATIIASFQNSPQTEENIKKSENLIAAINYKF